METQNKNIKLKYKGKKYNIKCYQNKNNLYFKDKNGASIGFIKNGNALIIFISDEYSKTTRKNYPNLKGINAYTLAPEQVKIFIDWLKK